MNPLRLPWPSPLLNPNHRGHWRKPAEAKKKARADAQWMARSARLTTPEGQLHVRLTFCPPDRRRRDLDNLQASMKAALDGLADGLGVNDNLFRPASQWGDVDPTGRGYVLVEIEPWEREARSIGELVKPIVAAIAERVEKAA